METFTITDHQLAVSLPCDDCYKRYALGSVQLGRRDNRAFMAGTDGHRIHVTEWDNEGDDFEVLLPGTLFDMSSHGGEVLMQLTVTAKCGKLTVGDVTLSAEIQKGKFPDWRAAFAEVAASTKHQVHLRPSYVRDAAKFCDPMLGHIVIHVPLDPDRESGDFKKVSVLSDGRGNKVMIMPMCQEDE